MQHEQRALVAGILEAAAERRPAAVEMEPCLSTSSVSAIEELADEGRALSRRACSATGMPGWRSPARPARCAASRRVRRGTCSTRLVQAVIAASGTVTSMRADAALRRHTVGARLRFQVPAPTA